tara:strand:+ start:454 stop:636 length:183 start_codon:yes stop_codon:yes gene_type:complete
LHEDLADGYDLDDASMKILSKIESKSVALKYIKRFPKKVAKPAPKKKAPAKKVKEDKGDE